MALLELIFLRNFDNFWSSLNSACGRGPIHIKNEIVPNSNFTDLDCLAQMMSFRSMVTYIVFYIDGSTTPEFINSVTSRGQRIASNFDLSIREIRVITGLLNE